MLPSDLNASIALAMHDVAPYPSAVASRVSALVARLSIRLEDEGLPPLDEQIEAAPRLAEVLVSLFAGSTYLSGILLQHPEALAELREPVAVAAARTPQELAVSLRTSTANTSGGDTLTALRTWQRQELLRVGASDLLGLWDVPSVTSQLSHLADVCVQGALEWAASQTDTDIDGFGVLAMGKLGGGELNYSSDIDLVLVTRRDPGAYAPLAARLVDALTRVTPQGFLYRVDLRLRPWGGVGPLVCSDEGYISYIAHEARLWEKQALLKARAIAGDTAGSVALLDALQKHIFAIDTDVLRRDVREMKRRIERQLIGKPAVADGRGQDVKHGIGSIRDVEFVTQYLQLLHGGHDPRIRSHNTLEALRALRHHRVLSAEDHRALSEGYTFLRPVEHYLQMVNNRQTHELPRGDGELDALARRLGFQGTPSSPSSPTASFLARYRQHSQAIRAVYRRYLIDSGEAAVDDSPLEQPDVSRHVARMAPSYLQAFGADEVRRHAELAEQLGGDQIVFVEAEPREDGTWRVTIVALDFPGELSVICGLLMANGINIMDGHVYTYEPPQSPHPANAQMGAAEPRKIVDVFTIAPTDGPIEADLWEAYKSELGDLLRQMAGGDIRGAQSALVRRTVQALSPTADGISLTPIVVSIDNDLSERYTVLDIEALDTPGFLYEFSHALAINELYIARVEVDSVGNRAYDRFYLTDHRGLKIADARRQRELRATTVLVKHFTHLLPLSPDPVRAQLHFRDFVARLFARSDWPAELASLENPEVLRALARLLGVSDFLWDDFLRMQHANLFPVLENVDGLQGRKSNEQLAHELECELADATSLDEQRAVLNAFKDREAFRVDMRHILDHIPAFGQFAAELTDVCEVTVDAAYRSCYDHLAAALGTPRLQDGSPCPMVVCGLGKCGGRELGYASDIELLFVYAGEGQTTGPDGIASSEFYQRLVVCFLASIEARREGIFELDLRLRPYGEAGSLAVPIDAFERYFSLGGPAWPYERQALVKLRPIAGDFALGERIVALRDAIVFHSEALNVSAIRAMRERQVRHLVAGGTMNAKYSAGGLVDVEYLVQGLQMRHGAENSALRVTNTREAIEALGEAGVLTLEQTAQLRQAHVFLRRLIDALRMVRGDAKDLTVPAVNGPGGPEFAFLARRLGYGADVGRLHEDIERFTETVRDLARLLLDETDSTMLTSSSSGETKRERGAHSP